LLTQFNFAVFALLRLNFFPGIFVDRQGVNLYFKECPPFGSGSNPGQIGDFIGIGGFK
jgi:hypothetical protein